MDCVQHMRKLFSFVATSISLAAACTSAVAGLGSGVTSVEADRIAMQNSASPATGSTPATVTAKQTSLSSYTQYEFALPSGTLVREFVSNTGVVFAVSWSGPFIPDLQQLLGESNFKSFTTAVREQSERGPQVVKQGSLVVRSSGRMRAFTGSAYLVDQMPSGVKPDDLQ